jgi:hypothetical protein
LNLACLDLTSPLVVVDPPSDVFRSQLVDVDHGLGSWFSVVNDRLKFSRWAVIPRAFKNLSQAAAIVQL